MQKEKLLILDSKPFTILEKPCNYFELHDTIIRGKVKAYMNVVDSTRIYAL